MNETQDRRELQVPISRVTVQVEFALPYRASRSSRVLFFSQTTLLAAKSTSRQPLNMVRNCCRSAIADAEYSPCFVVARRIRSIPSAVLGPVLRPPCSLQRPFRMAGDPHAPLRRFLAPHRCTFLML